MSRIMFPPEAMTAFGTVKLGALIDALKPLMTDEDGDPRYVSFAFGRLDPATVDSYRGYYDHVAIGYENRPESTRRLHEWLPELESVVGKTLHGYKGGEYVMTRHTPVWVSNWGENSGTTIVGLAVACRDVAILTDCDYS